MATLEQLSAALIKADAAGNADDARAFAAEIRKMRGAEPAPMKMDPTEGMSTFDKVAAGVGGSVVNTARGIGQLFGAVSQQEVDEAAARDKALNDTTEGAVGNVGGQIAQLVLPAGAVTKGLQAANVGTRLLAGGAKGAIARAGAGSAAYGATQPVLTGETRAGNAAVSGVAGVAGQGVVSGIGALAQPAKAAMSPAIAALAAKAEAAGIPIRMDQLSDSRFVKTLASMLEKLPFTGAGASRTNQQQSFNRAVSKTFGEDSPNVTQDVYAGAKRRIGGEFERLSSQNTLNLEPRVINALVKVEDDAVKFGNNDTAKAVKNAIDELLSKADANGAVPGKAYQSLDSKLGKLTKSGDEKALYIGQVRDAVREAMDSSINAADKEAWKTARTQYRNLKTVRDLVAKEGADGNISPALLAGRINANNAGKESMAMGGGGELGDLARIGRQFVRDPIPDSGTAGRLAALGALGGGGYALGIDPTTVLATVAGGATGGRAINALLNSQAGRNYMLKGSPYANKLAELLRPLPYAAAPLALDLSR